MPPSRVRSRTLAHLDRLIAIGVVATACHTTGYGVVDPIPEPVVPEPKPPDPDPGYGVVDPMPAPAKCVVFAESLSAWATTDGTTVQAFVAPDFRYRDSAVLSGEPTVTGATLKTSSLTPQQWVLELTPAAGKQEIVLRVSGTCEGAPETAKVVLTWSGELIPQGAINATIGAGG